jgi:hypothetical protein
MTGPGSFRHHSLGGSVSFAHPGHGFTFGCTVESQMGPAHRRPVSLVDSVVRCCVA